MTLGNNCEIVIILSENLCSVFLLCLAFLGNARKKKNHADFFPLFSQQIMNECCKKYLNNCLQFAAEQTSFNQKST